VNLVGLMGIIWGGEQEKAGNFEETGFYFS
jgi:hypothetical protein